MRYMAGSILATTSLFLLIIIPSGCKTEPVVAKENIRNTAPLPGMIEIPAGWFWMGCNPKIDAECEDNEKPGRKVYLDAYWIDQTEVTVEEYSKCVEANRCSRPKPMKISRDKTSGPLDPPNSYKYCNWKRPGGSKHPINCIAWNDAKDYCQWAGKRLPTEAEWEKAARGDDGRKYPWGNDPLSCQYAIIDDGGAGCGRNSTWPVCSKKKGNSSYGICDMAGNVSEFVSDRFNQKIYSTASNKNPERFAKGTDTVLRGSALDFPASKPGLHRLSIRDLANIDAWHGNVGFRCALSPEN